MDWKHTTTVAIQLAAITLLISCNGGRSNIVEVTSSITPEQRQSLSTAHSTTSNQARFANTVAAHNHVRAAHGLAGLQWSDSLAAYAQEWANQLASTNSCFMRHRPDTASRFKQQYGENLWWASPQVWSDGVTEFQNITIDRVVHDWASEQPFYNYQTNTCQAGEQCGHYTQIVWKDTTHVGCAYQQCSDKSQLWVCNYNPPGNYIGERPY